MGLDNFNLSEAEDIIKSTVESSDDSDVSEESDDEYLTGTDSEKINADRGQTLNPLSMLERGSDSDKNGESSQCFCKDNERLVLENNHALIDVCLRGRVADASRGRE